MSCSGIEWVVHMISPIFRCHHMSGSSKRDRTEMNASTASMKASITGNEKTRCESCRNAPVSLCCAATGNAPPGIDCTAPFPFELNDSGMQLSLPATSNGGYNPFGAIPQPGAAFTPHWSLNSARDRPWQNGQVNLESSVIHNDSESAATPRSASGTAAPALAPGEPSEPQTFALIAPEPEKPSSDLTPFMRQWTAAKRENPDALLFFRMGDFYELFYDDAGIASRELQLTLTARDKERQVPMCGVPYHAVEGYLARLLRK